VLTAELKRINYKGECLKGEHVSQQHNEAAEFDPLDGDSFRHLGSFSGREFYVLRWFPQSSVQLPFTNKRFSALLSLGHSVSDENAVNLVSHLEQNGLTSVMIHGESADKITKIYDRYFEDSSSGTYAMLDESENLRESLEYFMTPDDVSEIGLILVLGDDAAWDAAISSFREICIDDLIYMVSLVEIDECVNV